MNQYSNALPVCPACYQHAGTAGAPIIVRVDEPTTAGSEFVVWFKYPSNNNVQ